MLLKSTLTAEAWSTVTEVLLVFAKRKQERFDIHTFLHPFFISAFQIYSDDAGKMNLDYKLTFKNLLKFLEICLVTGINLSIFISIYLIHGKERKITGIMKK